MCAFDEVRVLSSPRSHIHHGGSGCPGVLYSDFASESDKTGQCARAEEKERLIRRIARRSRDDDISYSRNIPSL